MAMNMEAVLRIAAKVEGGTALERLGKQLVGVGESAGKTISPFGLMKGALRGIADVAATIGLASLGRDLLQAGIDAQAADTRIRALSGEFNEIAPLTNIAAKAAQAFALGNVEAKNAITDLYGRLRPMGVPLKDIETVFFGINKAAKQVGLSSYDTSEVLLQLSQALGSGRLQGDELRSIMERMPAVGQAVAKVMGVSASEIKRLGSEGKITTDVMIEAAAELNKIQPPPPTPMQEFEKSLKDLRTELGENLLPILTPFVQGLTGIIEIFAAMPEPLQTAIVLIGGLAIAAGPIASVITGIGNALIVIGPLLSGILATIAGWAGAIGPAMAAISAAFSGLLAFLTGTVLPGLLAFFSGPVGWTVLAVAAVVAMVIAFREPIMKFLSWLWEWGKPIREFWIGLWNSAVEAVSTFTDWIGPAISEAFDALIDIAYTIWVKPFVQLWDTIKEPVTTFTDWIGPAISEAFDALIDTAYTIWVKPFVQLWDTIKEPVTTYFSWVKGSIEWWAKALWAVWWQIFVQPFINAWDLIKDAASTVGDAIRNAWQGISGWFVGNVVTPIQNAWQGLMGYLQQLLQPALNWLGNAWKAVGQAFNAYVVTPIQNAWVSALSWMQQRLMDALQGIQGIWTALSNAFNTYVADPISRTWDAVISALPKAMDSAVKFIQGIWTGMINGIKSAVRGMLQSIANSINTVAGLINRLIGAFNALPGPNIPYVPLVTIPQFAAGGVVDQPTVAMVGEGGEREYIVPESKMAAASARFLSGARGAAVVPGGNGGISIGNPQINVTTGPVLQQNGQQYVTIQDLERAMRMTADGVIGQLRTPSARIALGLR